MLSVSGLSFGFRGRPLFRNVSFEIRSGELLHLAGPNGSGKSTMISIIAGLRAPADGKISFVTNTDRHESDDRRLYMEYLPAEANGLFLKMSAVQNLKFWATLRGHRLVEGALESALEQWKLNHPILRHTLAVEKYSTGMKRRLALARLQLASVPCWLLDEPVYGLDSDAIGQFTEALMSHLRSGGSALIVSHELKPVRHLISKTISLGQS